MKIASIQTSQNAFKGLWGRPTTESQGKNKYTTEYYFPFENESKNDIEKALKSKELSVLGHNYERKTKAKEVAILPITKDEYDIYKNGKVSKVTAFNMANILDYFGLNHYINSGLSGKIS